VRSLFTCILLSKLICRWGACTEEIEVDPRSKGLEPECAMIHCYGSMTDLILRPATHEKREYISLRTPSTHS
jgi:hypothetical protein